jgi:hypothetical protein
VVSTSGATALTEMAVGDSTLHLVDICIQDVMLQSLEHVPACIYVGVLISLWLFLFPIFLFAPQPKEFFLDGLKKLEQRSHKCVELRGEYVE